MRAINEAILAFAQPALVSESIRLNLIESKWI